LLTISQRKTERDLREMSWQRKCNIKDDQAFCG